jgi:hypothetical protein
MEQVVIKHLEQLIQSLERFCLLAYNTMYSSEISTDYMALYHPRR